MSQLQSLLIQSLTGIKLAPKLFFFSSNTVALPINGSYTFFGHVKLNAVLRAPSTSVLSAAPQFNSRLPQAHNTEKIGPFLETACVQHPGDVSQAYGLLLLWLPGLRHQ